MLFSKNIIYGLVDPRTRMIRYIGQTTKAQQRAADHRYAAKHGSTHRDRWVKQLLDAGLQFEMVELDSCESTDDLDSAEIWWIAYGKALGWPLTNITSGGGTSFYVMPEESRRKISEKAIARGPRPQSDEERARRSEMWKGKRYALGFKHSDAAKAAIAAGQRGRKQSSATRNKIADSKQGLKPPAQPNFHFNLLGED